MIRPKYEIVLRYLTQGEGERKVKLYPEHSLEFGMVEGKLHHILWNSGDEMWCESDMTLNNFIQLCEQISVHELTGMAASTALTSIRRGQ